MLLFAFAVGLFIFLPNAVAQEAVHYYTSDIAKYSVVFPAEFKNLDGEKKLYATKSNGMTFFAYHAELENKDLVKENENNVLLILLYTGVQNDLGGKVESQESVTVNGYTGKRGVFKVGELYGNFYVFLNADSGYSYNLVVLEQENEGTFNPELANDFIKSFKIL